MNTNEVLIVVRALIIGLQIVFVSGHEIVQDPPDWLKLADCPP